MTRHAVNVTIWDEKTGNVITIPVDLDINVAKLAFDLGRRANRSKHRKASAMHGAIKATIPPRRTP